MTTEWPSGNITDNSGQSTIISDDGSDASSLEMTSLIGATFSLVTGICLISFLAVSFALYHRRLTIRRRKDQEYQEYFKILRPDLTISGSSGSRARFASSSVHIPTSVFYAARKTLAGIENEAFEPETNDTKICPHCMQAKTKATRSVSNSKHKQLVKKEITNCTSKFNSYDEKSDNSEDRSDMDGSEVFSSSLSKDQVSNESVNISTQTNNRSSTETEAQKSADVSEPSRVRKLRSKYHANKHGSKDSVVLKADVHISNRDTEIEKSVNFDTDYFHEYEDNTNPYYDECGSVAPSRKQSLSETAFTVDDIPTQTVWADAYSRSLPVLENSYFENDFVITYM